MSDAWIFCYPFQDLGEERFYAMALLADVPLWSASDVLNHTDPSLANDTDCKLPWVDFVETKKSNVDIVILICLLLTLFFDTFLIAIIPLSSKAQFMWTNIQTSVTPGEKSISIFFVIYKVNK